MDLQVNIETDTEGALELLWDAFMAGWASNFNNACYPGDYEPAYGYKSEGSPYNREAAAKAFGQFIVDLLKENKGGV